MMKRFYLKRVSDFVTVVHRPTHQMIMIGNMDSKMGKEIKKFIKMTTEEFYKELISLGLKFNTQKNYNEERDKDNEDWYKGAWLFTTNQVLDNYNIKLDSIPEEEVPYDLLKELQKRDSKDWDISVKEETKEAPGEQKEEEQKKPRKLLKKKANKLPKKVGNEKVISLGGYKDLKELEEAYSGGELSTRDYIKLKRKLL